LAQGLHSKFFLCAKICDMATLRSVSFVLSFGLATSLKICGNFCGPNWCNGQDLSECSDIEGSTCNKQPSDCPETTETDGSCADGCCKAHDACCGGDRTSCNQAIIACLKACPSGPFSPGQVCMDGVLPVPVDSILLGMELDPYGCCGHSCDAGNATVSV